MRIGELARRLGVSRDTIRRWEEMGIVKPARDWAGHRRFTEADLALLLPMVKEGRRQIEGAGK